MGRITDPAKARDLKVPCHGFVIAPDKTVDAVWDEIQRTGEIPGKDLLLWKEGLIGPLTDDQDVRLCSPANLQLEDAPPKFAYRLELMRGLREGKYICVEPVGKDVALEYLRKRMLLMVGDGEKAALRKFMEDLEAVPSCPG